MSTKAQRRRVCTVDPWGGLAVARVADKEFEAVEFAPFRWNDEAQTFVGGKTDTWELQMKSRMGSVSDGRYGNIARLFFVIRLKPFKPKAPIKYEFKIVEDGAFMTHSHIEVSRSFGKPSRVMLVDGPGMLWLGSSGKLPAVCMASSSYSKSMPLKGSNPKLLWSGKLPLQGFIVLLTSSLGWHWLQMSDQEPSVPVDLPAQYAPLASCAYVCETEGTTRIVFGTTKCQLLVWSNNSISECFDLPARPTSVTSIAVGDEVFWAVRLDNQEGVVFRKFNGKVQRFRNCWRMIAGDFLAKGYMQLAVASSERLQEWTCKDPLELFFPRKKTHESGTDNDQDKGLQCTIKAISARIQMEEARILRLSAQHEMKASMLQRALHLLREPHPRTTPDVPLMTTFVNVVGVPGKQPQSAVSRGKGPRAAKFIVQAVENERASECQLQWTFTITNNSEHSYDIAQIFACSSRKDGLESGDEFDLDVCQTKFKPGDTRTFKLWQRMKNIGPGLRLSIVLMLQVSRSSIFENHCLGSFCCGDLRPILLAPEKDKNNFRCRVHCFISDNKPNDFTTCLSALRDALAVQCLLTETPIPQPEGWLLQSEFMKVHMWPSSGQINIAIEGSQWYYVQAALLVANKSLAAFGGAQLVPGVQDGEKHAVLATTARTLLQLSTDFSQRNLSDVGDTRQSLLKDYNRCMEGVAQKLQHMHELI